MRAALVALRLVRFRNYVDADIALDGRPVVLFGANGSGKTNLLEAVSLLAPGRGMRRASVEEIARRGVLPTDDVFPGDLDPVRGMGDAWAISADIAAESGVIRAGVGQDPQHPSRKIVRLDGAAASQSDLGRLVRVTWLTPAQDRVFAGPRGERLKFFDRLVLALRPEHGTAAARYEKAMRERGRLLDEGRFDPAWLDGLEAEMAARGVALAAARADLLDRLQAAVDERPDGAFPKADFTLGGDGSGGLEARVRAGEEIGLIETDFRDALAVARRRDAAAGRALIGPPRTDFAAALRAKAMPAGDCSTGEQKALLVGLALAHARALVAERGGALPLLLLDEAVAHLDKARRAALTEELLALDAQSWLTGTDRELFSDFGDRAQMFAVSEGRAEEA